MEFFFGTGSLYGRQTGVSNPTPIRFGGVQEASVDFSFEVKELFSQYQFPLAVARGTAKITGKAKFAALSGIAFNNIFFGESSLGNTPILTSIDEVNTVSNSNLVTVAQAANYVQDLGVLNVSTGAIMTRVAAGPLGTTQYAVNESTGNYTFNNAMAQAQVMITYDYNGAANSGTLVTGVNQLVGSAPQFLMVLSGSFQNKAMRMKLNACMASKLSLGTKLADYMLPEFDFNAFVDVTGNWGQLSFAE